MRDRVSKVISKQFHVSSEQITEVSRIDDDLAATSVDRLEFVMALEDEFAIVISDDQASRLTTVGDVLACVLSETQKARVVADHPSKPLV